MKKAPTGSGLFFARRERRAPQSGTAAKKAEHVPRRVFYKVQGLFPSLSHEAFMTITINTESSEGFRHSVQIDDHQLFADVPKAAGGEGSAPEPHDYFDAALGTCKALTLKLYAQKKGIPLTGVT